MTKNYKTCVLFASLIVILTFCLIVLSYNLVNIPLDTLTPTIDFTKYGIHSTSHLTTFNTDYSVSISSSDDMNGGELISESSISKSVSLLNNEKILLESRLQHLRNFHIMGGEIVSDEHLFPHAASLQVSLDGDSYHLCGASLIDHRWLVTASHCCFDDSGNQLDASTLTVVLGNGNLKKCSNRVEVKRNGCIRKKVHQLIPHPLYDSNVVLNDIALIELKEAVEFSTSIRPIEIPDDNPNVGTELVLTGWGSDPNDKKSTYLLKETRFPLLDENACANIGLTISRTRGQVCAGKDGSDACSGDSGSALFEEKRSCDDTDEFYCYAISGLVSYGKLVCNVVIS